MPLDTKQKRGSAIQQMSASRQWLSSPSGSNSIGHRLSLVKLTFRETPVAPSGGEIIQTAQMGIGLRYGL